MDHWNRIESLRNTSIYFLPRTLDEEKTVSSINCTGKTGYPHAEE